MPTSRRALQLVSSPLAPSVVRRRSGGSFLSSSWPHLACHLILALPSPFIGINEAEDVGGLAKTQSLPVICL